ncbi:MAG: hypothetical protein ACAH95_12195 [Fimbriimonas sp.]
MQPTPEEQARRDEVFGRVLQFIRESRTIKLPAFDRNIPVKQADYALLAIEPNDFSGNLGPFRYQFEGEDDLLHIAVAREEGGTIQVQEARKVLSFLLPEVAPALVWLKPGTVSQHFYVGHDELLR